MGLIRGTPCAGRCPALWWNCLALLWQCPYLSAITEWLRGPGGLVCRHIERPEIESGRFKVPVPGGWPPLSLSEQVKPLMRNRVGIKMMVPRSLCALPLPRRLIAAVGEALGHLLEKISL